MTSAPRVSTTPRCRRRASVSRSSRGSASTAFRPPKWSRRGGISKRPPGVWRSVPGGGVALCGPAPGARRQRKLRGERADLVAVIVGFVDLVGFTPLARRLTVAELGALVERFEGLASDVTVARGGRLVKHVGDAVMFIAPAADVA